MLSYIVFLRVTPILPNTFINVASPVVRVPLMPFIVGKPLFRRQLFIQNVVSGVLQKVGGRWRELVYIGEKDGSKPEIWNTTDLTAEIKNCDDGGRRVSLQEKCGGMGDSHNDPL